MSILDLLGNPSNSSQHGEQVDQMNAVIHWLMFVLFVWLDNLLLHLPL